MDIYTHLKTFNTVVRCENFSEAAIYLNVVPSVIAKRITQLEHLIGIKLFDRTTRNIAITEEGRNFYQRSNILLKEIEELMQNAKNIQNTISGHIKILSPTTLSILHLNKVFNDFLKEHPQISLEISLIDISKNPIDDNFDLAISGRSATYEGVLEIPLTAVESRLYASPKYLEGKPKLTHPSQLHSFDCLSFKPAGTTWNLMSNKGIINVDYNAKLQLDDNISLINAVIDGLGIASVPYYIAKKYLEAGKIIPILEQFPLQSSWFKLFIPVHKMNNERTKALIEKIMEYFNNPKWIDEY